MAEENAPVPGPPAQSTAVDPENVPVVFTLDGDTYSVPPANKWKIATKRHFEESHDVLFMEGLLGFKQWRKWEAKHPDADSDTLGALYTAWQEAMGVGNS